MTTELEFERKFTAGLFLMGGLVSLVFGILLLVRTQGTIEVIMMLVGLWWLIQGLFNILAIFIDKSQWGWRLIGGIFGILAGVLVLNFPALGGAIALSVNAIILGVLGIIFGLAFLVAAFQGGGWGFGLFGAVSIVVGLLMVFNSLLTAQIMIYIFAILLIIQGAAGVFLGLANRN